MWKHFFCPIELCKSRPLFFPATCEWEYQRNLAVALLFDIYNEMEPTNWKATSKEFIIRQYHRFYHLYVELNRYFRENVCRYGTFYHMIPKFHLMIHIFEDSVDNPRDEWCYIDESEIGSCAQMASHLHATALQRSLIKRYRVGGCVRSWSQRFLQVRGFWKFRQQIIVSFGT